MNRQLLDRLRHETHVAIHIATRDLVRQLAAIAMVLAVCWHAGLREPVFWIAAVSVGSEIAVRIIARLEPPQIADIGLPLILAMWTVNVGALIAYLTPAVLLAGQPSVALMIAGLLWLFGVTVHCTNTFSGLPIQTWSQVIPCLGAALLSFEVARRTAHGPSDGIDWAIAAFFVVVYALNTFETMRRQSDTHSALESARAQASDRLVALEAAARRDGLTGLLNRGAFDNALAEMLSRRRGQPRVAVYLIDLDAFKPINDSYSHAAGDTVLVALAGRLREIASAGGIVARLGGDEFIVALPEPDTTADVIATGEAMLAAIEAPVRHGSRTLQISASIGIALSGQVTQGVAALCAAADQAMFRAKSESGGRVVLFDPADFPPRPSLEDRNIIAVALRHGAIRPHYQPKVALDTGATIGFEALARWDHPERGLLLPADFLPQIRDLGLQGEFLTAMVQAVLADVATLRAEGLDPGQVSVNLPEAALATQSGRSEIDRMIAAAPEAARHLTFEITEDVFIARAGGQIQDSIAHFRGLGLRVSLDDFGTGFASFQHLRQLDFDELKIDRSLVADLDSDGAAQLLVRAFLDIGQGLGADVIAEGVETEGQRKHLLALGCRLGQGFHFGRAMPFADMRTRLIAAAAEDARTRNCA